MPERGSLTKSPRFTLCVAKKTKLSNGWKPPLMIAMPECSAYWQIRYYAACATMLDTRTYSPKSAYPQRHEQKAFVVCRAEATECLQSCRGVHRGRVGAVTGHRAGISSF